MFVFTFVSPREIKVSNDTEEDEEGEDRKVFLASTCKTGKEKENIA